MCVPYAWLMSLILTNAAQVYHFYRFEPVSTLLFLLLRLFSVTFLSCTVSCNSTEIYWQPDWHELATPERNSNLVESLWQYFTVFWTSFWCSENFSNSLENSHGDHLLTKWAKCFEKLIFLTPRYTNVSVYIRGLEMLFFREILGTH